MEMHTCRRIQESLGTWWDKGMKDGLGEGCQFLLSKELLCLK